MRFPEFHILVEAFLVGVGVYSAIGLVAALALAIWGVASMDQSIAASPRSVRVLLLPGLIALWPVMLLKWVRVSRGGGVPSNERSPAHTPEAGG